MSKITNFVVKGGVEKVSGIRTLIQQIIADESNSYFNLILAFSNIFEFFFDAEDLKAVLTYYNFSLIDFKICNLGVWNNLTQFLEEFKFDIPDVNEAQIYEILGPNSNKIIYILEDHVSKKIVFLFEDNSLCFVNYYIDENNKIYTFTEVENKIHTNGKILGNFCQYILDNIQK